MEQPAKAKRREPLLGAALMKRALVSQPGGLEAHRDLYRETLRALGLTEQDVDRYEASHGQKIEAALTGMKEDRR